MVVETNKNLGFACGNNFGYEKLKEVCDCDFVIFSNSDIVLNDSNFLQWILGTFEKERFAILGPSIFSTGWKCHQIHDLTFQEI